MSFVHVTPIFLGGVYCYHVFSGVAKTTYASGRNTSSLEGGVLLCHGVLDHGLNLRWNIPLK